MRYPSTTAIIQESEDSTIPEFIDITPAVLPFEIGKKQEITVTLSNLSTDTVTISPKAIICELQPVTVTEEVFNNIVESEEKKGCIKSLEFGSKRDFNRGRERKIEMSPSQT